MKEVSMVIGKNQKLDNKEDKNDKLYRKISNTRYSRIRAEERINRKSKIVVLINIWLSCWIIVFTLLSSSFTEDIFSLSSLIMSIFLLGFIVYYSCQNYSERSYKMRENYTALEKLELRLCENHKISETEYEEIYNSYCDLLYKNENHKMFDYDNAAHIRSLNHNNYIRKYLPITKKRRIKNMISVYCAKHSNRNLDDRILMFTTEMKYRRIWGWL